MSVAALVTRKRVLRLTGFASTQVAVQSIGFAASIVLVRAMDQYQYGYYTLALSLTTIATILSDLGLASAVMAVGGRMKDPGTSLGGLVASADALHRRLAIVACAVLLPCGVALLVRQNATPWQVGTLVALIALTAVVNVRSGVALSIARVLGDTGYQQRLDLGLNATKLALVTLAAAVALDATTATVINLLIAVLALSLWRRYLRGRLASAEDAAPAHAVELRRIIGQQAPNSIWFVFSSQVTLWLVGVFGTAASVAEVGALSRLAAVLTVIGIVSGALVLPYFARQDSKEVLAAAFVAVNTFYAALLALLTGLAVLAPGPFLWLLGSAYGNLRPELAWMVVAATLGAWSGAVYSIGCARGWVMPIWIVMSVGVAAIAAAALLVDPSSVRGSFQINAASGLAGTLAAIAYFSWRLRRQGHAELVRALP